MFSSGSALLIKYLYTPAGNSFGCAVSAVFAFLYIFLPVLFGGVDPGAEEKDTLPCTFECPIFQAFSVAESPSEVVLLNRTR